MCCRDGCCTEYSEFLGDFGDIVLGYAESKGRGVRVLLKEKLNFKCCPFCGVIFQLDGN